VYASLAGQRPMQILGQGFTGTAQDQRVFLKTTVGSTTVTAPGPTIDKAFNFNSDISRGIIYYEAPSPKTLLGEAIGSKISSMESEVFVQGPSSAGVSELFSCETDFHCKIKFGMPYTPQIMRIYPSTVYAGQTICFNVFTDYAADGREMYLSSKIGVHTMEFESYDYLNQPMKSTWNDFQI
jgi:hypothetical protein